MNTAEQFNASGSTQTFEEYQATLSVAQEIQDAFNLEVYEHFVAIYNAALLKAENILEQTGARELDSPILADLKVILDHYTQPTIEEVS